MTRSKTASNTKHIIEATWNNVVASQNKVALLKRQGLRYSQNNLNPALITVPLITHEEIIRDIDEDTQALQRLATVENFPLSNMTVSLLPYVSVVRKFYREFDEKPLEPFVIFQKYTLNDITWKYIDNNTILLQILLPLVIFNNQTFMDLDLNIKNPNVYTTLPTYEIQI